MSFAEAVKNDHGRPTLAEELTAATGKNPACCYQCGKCSAGCPMALETRLRPHDIMRLIGQNRRKELLESESIWLCLTCETCAARCPNECDPARTMDALREMALAEAKGSLPRTLMAFHRSFLDQIRLNGRMFELGLMAEYKLRSGDFFADATAAPGMISRGKLGFLPHRIKAIKEVRSVFKACEAESQEAS